MNIILVFKKGGHFQKKRSLMTIILVFSEREEVVISDHHFNFQKMGVEGRRMGANEGAKWGRG